MAKKENAVVNENVNTNENVKEPEVKEPEVKAVKKTKIVVIPVSERDQDSYVPVCINGKIFQVKKGEEVEVPEEVYNLLKRGGYLGIKAK